MFHFVQTIVIAIVKSFISSFTKTVLATGFTNASWSPTVDFANASPVLRGSKSIKAINNAFTAFAIGGLKTLNSSDYTGIKFSLYGSQAINEQNKYLY